MYFSKNFEPIETNTTLEETIDRLNDESSVAHENGDFSNSGNYDETIESLLWQISDREDHGYSRGEEWVEAIRVQIQKRRDAEQGETTGSEDEASYHSVEADDQYSNSMSSTKSSLRFGDQTLEKLPTSPRATEMDEASSLADQHLHSIEPNRSDSLLREDDSLLREDDSLQNTRFLRNDAPHMENESSPHVRTASSRFDGFALNISGPRTEA
jgi:hypothetical protein